MATLKVLANYYQQFDADYELDIPAEGFGGWKRSEIGISLEHTAIAIMHAWDTGTPGEYPGWYNCVEYMPRANEILRTIFPPLLQAVRDTGLRVFHVVGGSDCYSTLPGYRRAVELAGPSSAPTELIRSDPVLLELQTFRARNAFVGPHNEADVRRGSAAASFPPETYPLANEGIAETSAQLFALCKAHTINHLIYAGFAINWCLLLSPGGMIDMSRHGIMCSAFPQAVTAVENKETAREELCKQIALWRVALGFGFVFDVPDFINALQSHQSEQVTQGIA